MDISRKTDYALRMLATLVENPEGVLSVRTAARDGRVPYSFARSIQHDLAVAGIVENTRGANGGMRLAVDPRKVTLLEVVEAVQGPVELSSCEDGAPCPNRAGCCYTSVWCNATRVLRAMLGRVTLHQLVVERLSPVMEGGFELVSEERARERCGAPARPDADTGADADRDAAPGEKDAAE